MTNTFKWPTAALLAVALGQHLAAHAAEVIAHASVTLSADEVKELYFGDKQLAGNVKLMPVDNAAQRADFQAKVLQMDAAKYTSRWAKKAFREGLVAPNTLGSDAEAIAYVKTTPGAVAYVAGPTSGVKVLLRF